MNRNLFLTLSLAAASILTTTPVLAGPPAICHGIDIGDAKSLPWGQGSDYNMALASYDLSKLSTDTVALLTPSAPVKVRMETIRRAALYSAKDTHIALEVAARLMARAMTSEAQGKKDPMAWFDAGYFVESLKQAALVYKWNMLSPSQKKEWAIKEDITGIDGVAWVEKAMSLGADNVDTRDALARVDFERAKKKAVVATR